MVWRLLAPALGLFLSAQSVLAQDDGDAFELFTAMNRIESGSLWPGFDPSSVPVAIYDGQRTYLFRHPSPPREFEQVEGQPGVWVYGGRHPIMSANSAVNLGGVHTATFLLETAGNRSIDQTAGSLLHEAFHVYQRDRHPEWTANEGELFVYPMHDAELLRLRRIETAALRRALAAEKDEEALCWTAAFLDAREARFDRMRNETVAYERGSELNEGLAQYIQDLAVPNVNSLRIPKNEFPPESVRDRSYAAGHALALLLDRFDRRWKGKLEQGEESSLDELLEDAIDDGVEACTFSQNELDAATEHAKSDLAQMDSRLASRRRYFLTRPGRRFVVVAEGGEVLWPREMDPSNVLVLGEGQVLHTRWLKLEGSGGTVEVLNRPSLTEAAGAHPLFDGVHQLTISGVREEPEVTQQGGRLAVRGQGFRADFANAKLEKTDEGLVLHVMAGERD